MAATLVCCNVGQPAPVDTNGQTVLTAIYKSPVTGPVRVGRLNLDGDRQADLTVHGGFQKAVYAYPSEHYPVWERELDSPRFSYGMFGENLTTAGLLEDTVHIGDQYRIGTAILQVTQPRMPCFKLALKFGRPEMVKIFWKSGRSGFYLSVVEEGVLEAGQEVEKVEAGEPPISISEVVRLYRDPMPSRDGLNRALQAPFSGGWKKGLRERLAMLE